VSILKAYNLVKEYKKRKVVNDVSLSVKQGEIVGLLGPNGAGKTTTFYMICGMIKPNEGEVELDGELISNFPMYKRAKMGIGYLPQEASIFRKMTVEQNILSVLQFMDLDKFEIEEQCEALLKELNINKVRD
jgi:lipopolysaccharide export system ATP-binding protein